jgi:hypothetical protein
MTWLLSRLKGGNMTAQGNALGLAIQKFTFALKGPGKEIPWLQDQSISPLQGDRPLEAASPRALPWADIFWPFRPDARIEAIWM